MSAAATPAASAQIPLGSSVPPHTPHAISVSLPYWDDNIGYEEGEKRVVDRMETGYPRFFIHRSVQKLAALCLAKFGNPDEELCMLFPSPKVAAEARDFLASRTPPVSSRAAEFVVCPGANALPSAKEAVTAIDCLELQIMLFAKGDWPAAKQFWQHTGDGISSRMAERALAFLGEAPAGAQNPSTPPTPSGPARGGYSRNRHYARMTKGVNTPAPASQGVSGPDAEVADLGTYVEERYGRNLPLFNAPLAKQALKRRIAGGLLPSDEEFGQADAEVARGVTPDDVYLFPGGMSAIWHAHRVAMLARQASGKPEGKSVCFGFPYTDTLKILQKWGAGCHFLGLGDTSAVKDLEVLLAENDKAGEAPILALFCEFPSNPLIRSPDLARLRALADQYGFVIVIDETIGNFLNVDVLPYADMAASSLTKIFSGDSNVMGGSLILNPKSSQYAVLKAALDKDYEDNYYPEDAVYMERNSRDYRGRIRRVNDNAFAITEYLHSVSLMAGPGEDKVIKRVYYPRYETPELYAACARTPSHGAGGFGGLFSLTFTSTAAARAFYDTLPCAKGPSLGTSFTLASPYAILAHYTELDWAAQFGVERDLVRISIGQEDLPKLRGWFEASIKAAQAAQAAETAPA
ncbi:hypothetical protein CcaverHIS002_0212230 [Cutaneotrichosporon cavernicola]|nr:hypothetical protein CcaverHIS002_0212230 [Cutaneotrichosporon cavernicola]BEI97632.1 hypothetical protein CcaverHIS631_0212210 [Cutaneotrichosporon cavernicola]BEJ05410.1 hypothetical protein CcaverHIS641_0212270 [Cutaneotrichosporon cavernicola]